MTTKAGATRRFFYVCKLLLLVPQAWLFNGLIVLDFALNWLTGGDSTETVSSRLGKGVVAGKPVHTFFAQIVDFIFLVLVQQKDHCLKSIQHKDGDMALSSVIDRHLKGEPPVWRL